MTTFTLKPQGGKEITLKAFDKVLNTITEVEGQALLHNHFFNFVIDQRCLTITLLVIDSEIINEYNDCLQRSCCTKLHCMYNLVNLFSGLTTMLKQKRILYLYFWRWKSRLQSVQRCCSVCHTDHDTLYFHLLVKHFHRYLFYLLVKHLPPSHQYLFPNSLHPI